HLEEIFSFLEILARHERDGPLARTRIHCCIFPGAFRNLHDQARFIRFYVGGSRESQRHGPWEFDRGDIPSGFQTWHEARVSRYSRAVKKSRPPGYGVRRQATAS